MRIYAKKANKTLVISNNYRKRVVDSLLAEKLEAMGAVLIEGPAWRHISRH